MILWKKIIGKKCGNAQIEHSRRQTSNFNHRHKVNLHIFMHLFSRKTFPSRKFPKIIWNFLQKCRSEKVFNEKIAAFSKLKSCCKQKVKNKVRWRILDLRTLNEFSSSCVKIYIYNGAFKHLWCLASTFRPLFSSDYKVENSILFINVYIVILSMT